MGIVTGMLRDVLTRDRTVDALSGSDVLVVMVTSGSVVVRELAMSRVWLLLLRSGRGRPVFVTVEAVSEGILVGMVVPGEMPLHSSAVDAAEV